MMNQHSPVLFGRKALVGLLALAGLILALSVVTAAQTFPRCISGCTANDVELIGISADVVGSCAPGGSVETSLWVSLHFNRKKTYCVRFVADVYIDGSLVIADLVSEPMNVFSNGTYPDIYFGTVSVPCGSSLSLENVQILWSVDKDYKDVSSCEDGSCAPYGPGSKCTGDQYGTIVISLPLDAQDDVAETDEDTPITIDLLANDLLGVEPTQITRLENASHGSTQINGDGAVLYVPNPDFHGTDSFAYTIEDSEGQADSALVFVSVYATNDAPEAHDDMSQTDENEAVVINILANDVDPDGSLSSSSVAILQSPSHGTIDIDPSTGVVTYAPSNGNCGNDSFTYTVDDNEGATSNEATVSIEILCNEAPFANDDTATTDENTAIAIDVAANDDDVDGSLDLTSIRITRSPDFGTISVHASSGVVTYMPDPQSCGDDTFSYTISDNDGAVSQEAEVTIAVLCDDPPLAIDDLYHVSEGESFTERAPGILENDIASPGNPLTATLNKTVSHGTLTLNSNGSFIYVHDGGETTSDQFTYYASTGTKDSNLAAVSLIIQPVNDSPIAIDDESSISEDTPVTVSVLSNDSDPDGDALFVDWVSQPANGSVANNGNSVTYNPDPDFHGTDSFTYAATDGNGGQAEATVTVLVTPVNDPPVAQDDSESAIEDTPAAIDVLNNDFDPDGDSLLIQSVTQPKHGTTTNEGTYITYVPKLNFNGTDTFTYVVTDDTGGISTATVSVSVSESNDPPVAMDDGDTIDEDTSIDIDVLANDSDPDGDGLFVQSVTQPVHGTAINNETSVSYIPNANFTGEETFTYTVCDHEGGQDTAIVYITVLPTNDAPVAQGDSDRTREDTSITLDVLANDSDPDGDDLAIQSVTQPGNGTAVSNGSDVTYSPNSNFTGIDSFTYTLSDGAGGIATATVTLTVTAVNDPPIAGDDTASTNEEAPVSIEVLLNDSDPDGDGLFIEAVTQPEHGTVLNRGTIVTYTPDPDFHGIDALTYNVADGNGGMDDATITIDVIPVNDPPVAQDDSAISEEDTLVSIPVLSNDSDPDGDFLFVESTSAPRNGSVIVTDTSVSYIPNPGFNGIDSFTYTISDGSGATATATVTVAVAAVNDPPTARDDAASTNEETPVLVSVLANDDDPDGDSLAIQSATQPANGAVINTGSSITYTPSVNFNGVDTFSYTISDGNGETASANVTISVAPVNDKPVAQNDSGATNEEEAVAIDVLANDSDPDGDPLSVLTTTQPANGTVINNGSSVTYTPNHNFHGTDAFSYAISDGHGETATANVFVSVSSVNDDPIAQADSAITDEETTVTISALANDSDPDGDPLFIQSATQPSHGTVVSDGARVTYSPAPEFNGLDAFSYTISDGNGGTATANISVRVLAVNDAPVARNDSGSTDEETAIQIAVLDNDSDPDGDALSVQAVTQPGNGTIVNNGTSISYTPISEFNGIDAFSYTLSDGNGGTASANVSITVIPINDAPIAQDDTAATNEDTPKTIHVLTNDSDPENDPLSIGSISQPTHGIATFNDSSIAYTPNSGFNGTDAFSYTISDGNGGTATANVAVTVTPVNDAPKAQNDSGATDEETSVTIPVLANDSDPDGDPLIVQSATQPANGAAVNNGVSVTYTPASNFNGIDTFSYTVSDGNGETATASVAVTVAPINDFPVAQSDSSSTSEELSVTIFVLANDSDLDGDLLVVQSATQPANGTIVNHGTSITYTPGLDFNGVDSFSYVISDGNGGTDEAVVTVAVALVNDLPIAVDDSGSTDEDRAVTIFVLSNDSDPDGDPLAVQSVTQSANGTVVRNGTSVTYTPAPDFNGVDSFSYTISDGNGGADTARVSVTVTAANDAPIAQDDSDSTDEETPVTIAVLSNDSDPDGDPLAVQSVTHPVNGTVVNNETRVTYSPDPDFNGIDSFSYTVSDGHEGTATAHVSVSVSSVNDAPIASDDSDSTDEETPVTIAVLSNDSDPDGDPLAVQSATQPNNGTVVNNSTSIRYTPNANFSGIDSFSYVVSDGNGGTAAASVTVAVSPVNDPPVAQNDSATTNEETDISISVLANDTDPDGDTLAVQSVTQPAHGTAVNNGIRITYAPDLNFNGVDTFSYTVSDGHGGTAAASISVSVSAVNDAPVASDDSASTDEETAVTISVLANDSDPDGHSLSVQSVAQPAHGSVVNNGTTVTYTPAANFNGLDAFSYTISDGNSGTATAIVSVTISAVNDAPVAQDDSDSTNEETPVTIFVLVNDTDPDGDALAVQATTQPTHGTVVNNGNNVTYTPTSNFNGIDSFSYTVSDGNSGIATANVSVAVALVNDRPIAEDDSSFTDEETPVTIPVVVNDVDPDGDAITVQSATQPAHGTVVNNGTTVTYTPAVDFNGLDAFNYTVSDANGGTDTASVSVTVNAVNDAPVAQDDSVSTDEETAITIAVLNNDTDPDGNPLSVQAISQPVNGTVVNNGSSVTYTPKLNFSGLDSFNYTVSDANGGTDAASVSVTVTASNDSPIAQGDSSSTTKGAPVVIDVLANDSDPDGDTLSIQSLTQPANGSVVSNGANATYTPNAQFDGLDSFAYVVSDGNDGTASATVTVAVAAVNQAPIALSDHAIVGEDSSITILVLSNDSDPDGDTISVLSTSQPLHGAVVANGTSIIYTPSLNFVGADSLTYTIADGHGGRSTAPVSLDVLSINDAPIAQDDAKTMQEGSVATISVLTNDSDPDHDSLRIESISRPLHGHVTKSGTELIYEPSPGYNGTDTFTYTVADGQGGTDTARVTILVSSLNDSPVAQHDSANTSEELLVTIPILTNDSDPDGDFLLIESFTQPQNGTVLNARTSLSYIPNPGFQGIDTFTYTVSDGNGGSAQATVTVSVAEINDAPIAQDDSAITDEGNPVTILTLLNDSDPDGDTLTIESVDVPGNGLAQILGDELVYTPDPGFDGVDTVTYTVSDGRGGTSTATVFIAVAPVNDSPIAQDDSITTVEASTVTVPVLANDSDPDGDPLSILSVTQPLNGAVTIVGTDLLYRPDDGFSGTDTFEYTIADGKGGSSRAAVTVGIDPLIAGAGGAASQATSCEGRVIISEIAWAGTMADSRDEWIELRNLGTTPVDLSGWLLRWRSTHPSSAADQIWKVIELAGVLPAANVAACTLAPEASTRLRMEESDGMTWTISGQPESGVDGFYVLERRSDASIQDLHSNLIYDVDRTLSLELSDRGEIIMLVNRDGDVVDTANASNLGRSAWAAGSASTRATMERIDPLKPDTASNWQTNFGLVIAGKDADGHLLRATPGLVNSPAVESLSQIASIDPVSVRAGEMLHADFSLSRQDRRTTGWPWICVIRPGFAGISGAGGSADYTSYAFSGTHQGNDRYALEIATSGLATGTYSFWIIYGAGEAVYIPILVSP